MHVARQPSFLENPYSILLQVSLALALLGGFGLGLMLLLSFVLRAPLPLNVGALIQAHGQVQAVGFITLFVMAVATRLLPRFHETELRQGATISVGGLLLAAGVVLRAVGQPLAPSSTRSAMLVMSGLLTLGGVLLAVSVFGATVRRGSQTREREPIVLPLTMAVSLVGFVLLNMVACIGLAAGNSTVPGALDEAILHLELWGFATTMVLAIARHTWPPMLLLRPARAALLRPSLVLWALGSLGTPLAWLLAPDVIGLRAAAALCQLAGAVLYVGVLRLFEPPARTPMIRMVTDYGRSWVRIAYGFLILAATINVVALLGEVAGSPMQLMQESGARHALAAGFLLPVIAFMAARILPGYSAAMMWRPQVLAALMGTLFIGAALRVGGEMVGGYDGAWGAAAAAGGSLTTIGFIVFAVDLWQENRRAATSYESILS